MITPKITFFNRYNCKLRYPDFTKESELHLKNELNKSIIENNKTMVGFYIRYYKSGNFLIYNYIIILEYNLIQYIIISLNFNLILIFIFHF